MLENLLFETHFDIIPFDVYVVDVVSYKIIYMNRHFKERFGDHTGSCCHKTLYELDRPCAFCKIKGLISKDRRSNCKTYVFEHFNEVDDRWYQLHEKAICWPDGRTVKYSIAVDISELKETQNRLAEAHAELALKNRELEILSTIDQLTGVYNRLKLDELLNREIARSARYGNPMCVILADIDYFKSVNDTHGHQVGDRVLVDVTGVLAERIRKSDLLGRWGGEEFVIICPETGQEGAEALAENLRCAIESRQPPVATSQTASFGVTVYKPDDTAERMIARADEALYKAKQSGRNRVEVVL